jgi:hypothetical protein
MKYTFTGSNGEEIAQDLISSGRSGARPGRPATVQVSTTHPGPSLSLDRVYGDGQVAAGIWRVPVDFTIDTITGEVTDREGRVWAYEDLVELP